MQSMLSHFVESHSAVVGSCNQNLQSLHDIHASDFGLHFDHFIQREIFVVLVWGILANLLFFFLLGLLVLFV